MHIPPTEEECLLHPVRLANYNLILAFLGGGVGLTCKTLGVSTANMHAYRERHRPFRTTDARKIEVSLDVEEGWMDRVRADLDPVPERLVPLEGKGKYDFVGLHAARQHRRCERFRALFPERLPRSNLLGAAFGLSGFEIGQASHRLSDHTARQIEDELGLSSGWFDREMPPTEVELASAGRLVELVVQAVEKRLSLLENPHRSPHAHVRALMTRIEQLDDDGKLTPDLAAELLSRLLSTDDQKND
ncbi:hypothetical protein F6X40_27785 [Paraburkholderia sp. UCT31]|uniref:hypothetical protein n=1 Tax=Paraburkholderia sp. UCT31 TaxID=2615209 RepID=UPI001654DF4A|nr:hypothetical protein [Paraburkholderia sp. UCT31]MBC8740441.1 hypothetical protein [Paraburkholderia sp. UCT31]